MKKKKLPEQHNDFEDAFIREIDEDLKNEKLKRIWDKYGLFIIIFVTVVIFAAVSFETIKAWQDKRNQEMSDTFAYALNLQNQGRNAEAFEVLTRLKNSDRGIYADIAQMQMADMLIEQNKLQDAINILQEICNNNDFNPQLHDVAVLKLASYKLNDAPADEIKQLLAPLTEKQSLWNNAAKEILAMLALRDNNLTEAKKLYQEISLDPKASDSMKSRALNMINVLE